MSLIASICRHRYSPGNDNYALACSIVMGRTLHNTNSPSSLSYTDTMASTHWRQKSMPDGWVHRYKLCRLNFINIYFLKTWCVLHGNIDNLLFRFNNNCQSPVSSVRHVAGEGVNGIKVSSSSGVGWSRPGEGDPASRSGDKPSSGRQNSLSVGKQKKNMFCIMGSKFSVRLRHRGFQSGDSSTSAVRAEQPRVS